MVNNTDKVNIYRDTPLRYLGYTNEVGEAFRSIVPKSVVWSSYLIACGYVLADTIYSARRIYGLHPSEEKKKQVLLSASDTLLWQGFASVIVPGFTINRICASVRFIQSKSVSKAFKSPWISTIVGLISIPFIIHPIDLAVEKAMDATYREWTGFHPKQQPNQDDK